MMTLLPFRPFALIVLAALVLLAGCGGEPEYTAHDIKGVMPDLQFELTDEQQQPVTAEDYAGTVRLIYFGYTNCPDICPATMARVRAALAGLDEAQRENIRVLFVSVDPKRDNPERLKRFTSSFGPNVIGLTGTQEQLKALTKRYRVTYGYGDPNENGFYLVSHSSAVFVFDPQGKARLLVNQRESVDELTADLQTLLDNS